MNRITFYIDDRELQIDRGKTILQAALEHDIDIPHFCYHAGLGNDGNCRICLVEIEGMPKLVISCTTPVSEGMKVYTKTEKVKNAQAGVLEFILLYHPLDCPVCDKAGECILQDYAYDHGYSHSRLEFPKEHFPVRDLGPKIYLWTERCIKCSRCVRFLEDIAGTGELGFRHRGVKTELDIFPENPVDNPMSLNIVDICPVGALLDKDFLFKARVWDLKKTESICFGCSAGCNITYWDLDNILKRVKPRANENVNGHWMCDFGRTTYKWVDREDRLTDHSAGAKKLGLEAALEELINSCEDAVEKYGADALAAIGSPFLTNEENYLIRRIFGDELGVRLGLMPSRIEGEDMLFGGGFTIKAEKAPNRLGALKALGLNDGKNDYFSEFAKRAREGKIKWAVIFNGDPEFSVSKELITALKKVKYLVVCESLPSGLSKIANLSLAGNLPAEKDGTYTNFERYTQRIRRSVFKPLDSEPEWKILIQLAKQWRKELDFIGPRSIFDEMAEKIKFFKNLDYELIGSAGCLCKE